MNNERLQRLLADLHRELGSATSVDATTRQLLDQVLQDVRELSPPPADAAEDVTEQVREAALRLEAEHPRLAAALGQVSDALAKLGI